jgi:ABC-type antimicrobial peptide transport system permease subunit
MHVIETVIAQFRRAARSLVRRPAFTAVVLLTLGLGIGANAAIFSIVNVVLLKSLPFEDPERLVMVWSTTANQGLAEGFASYPDFDDWRRESKTQRSGMTLLVLFGVLALTLSAAGIYGVMSHMVALRRSEIGIRMTLGAHPSAIMRLVVGEGLREAVIGLTIGVAGGIVVMRTFRALLFSVEPADPITIAAVTIVLLATAALACILPARRAMRVDPVEALRS